MNEKLDIKLKDWDHTCGDGCCYKWGTDIEVNGKLIEGGLYANSNDVMNGITSILDYLKIEYTINFEE
jgi:hypothetical protein